MQDVVICQTNAKLRCFSLVKLRRRFAFCLLRKVARYLWCKTYILFGFSTKSSSRENWAKTPTVSKSGDDLLEIVQLQNCDSDKLLIFIHTHTTHTLYFISCISFCHLRTQIAKARRGGRRGKVTAVITDNIMIVK